MWGLKHVKKNELSQCSKMLLQNGNAENSLHSKQTSITFSSVCSIICALVHEFCKLVQSTGRKSGLLAALASYADVRERCCVRCKRSFSVIWSKNLNEALIVTNPHAPCSHQVLVDTILKSCKIFTILKSCYINLIDVLPED